MYSIPECGDCATCARCCSPTQPCSEWQGDCNTNADCAGRLVCGQDNCFGSGYSETDDCCRAPLGGWANEWDIDMNFRCPTGKYISHMYSIHNNGREDRRFRFACSIGINLQKCIETSYIALCRTCDIFLLMV